MIVTLKPKAVTPVVGELGYDTNGQIIQVYDGNRWMDLATITGRKFFIVDYKVDKIPAPPKGHSIVDVDREVLDWIHTTQPVHSWKYDDIPAYSPAMTRLWVNNEVVMLMRLTWE